MGSGSNPPRLFSPLLYDFCCEELAPSKERISIGRSLASAMRHLPLVSHLQAKIEWPCYIHCPWQEKKAMSQAVLAIAQQPIVHR
jgi:hypothetical protein